MIVAPIASLVLCKRCKGLGVDDDSKACTVCEGAGYVPDGPLACDCDANDCDDSG